MYTFAQIVLFDQSGTNAIAEARERDIRIWFHRNKVFVNGHKFLPEKLLWQSFPIRTFLKFFIKEAYRPFNIKGCHARYEAELVWCGDVPFIHPFSLKSPSILYAEKRFYQNPLLVNFDCHPGDIYRGRGTICWASQNCGIIVKEHGPYGPNCYILFYPDDLLLFGKFLPRNECFKIVCAHLEYFDFYAKPIPSQRLFGVIVNFKAIIAWRGSERNFELRSNERPRNDQYNHSHPRFIPQHVKGSATCYPTEKPDYQKKYVKPEFSFKEKDAPYKPPLTNASQQTKEHFYCPAKTDNDSISCDKSNKLNSSIPPQKLINFCGYISYYNDEIITFGKQETYSSCLLENFYIHGKKCSSKKELTDLFASRETSQIINSYSYDIDENLINKQKVTLYSIAAWVGKGPKKILHILQKSQVLINENYKAKGVNCLNEKFNDLKLENCTKFSEQKVKEKINYPSQILNTGKAKNINSNSLPEKNDNSQSSSYLDKFDSTESGCKLASEEHLRGYLLSADPNEGIITSFQNIVVFGRKKFFVNGKKVGTKEDFVKFFESTTEMINAWVVPLDKPRVVQSCIVVSRAICAWVGKEPHELKTFKEQYYSLKSKESVEHPTLSMTSDMSGFEYFVGYVKILSEHKGVVEISRHGEKANVSFNADVVYKYGIKLAPEGCLDDHSLLLNSSLWSILAKFCPHRANNVTCNYEAVALWHFQNQKMMFDEFTQKLALWDKNSSVQSCECSERIPKEASSYQGFEVEGKFVTAGNEYAIFEIKSDYLGTGNIRCLLQDLWIDGCCCAYSNADKGRDTHLLVLGEIDSVLINGIRVSLHASCGWVGKRPSWIKTTVFPIEKFTNDLGKPHLEDANSLDATVLDGKTIYKGKTVQIHSNTGYLTNENNVMMFFQSSQVYLYGVSLKNVDLWNVLVQDQEVNFTMNEDVSKTIDAVWIGQRYSSNEEATVNAISKWCRENMVVDSAKNLLLSEVK